LPNIVSLKFPIQCRLRNAVKSKDVDRLMRCWLVSVRSSWQRQYDMDYKKHDL